jgi:hypothetical protein
VSVAGALLSSVIAGLDPAIHGEFQHAMELVSLPEGHFIMAARVKPAHDAETVARLV